MMYWLMSLLDETIIVSSAYMVVVGTSTSISYSIVSYIRAEEVEE